MIFALARPWLETHIPEFLGMSRYSRRLAHSTARCLIFLCGLWSTLALPVPGSENLPQPCDSEIYCYGPLLHTIQMAHLYPDSKTFVDMKLRLPANETLEKFDQFMDKTHSRPSQYDIERFINENFEPAGSEFEQWVPNDWVQSPALLSRIKDPVYRNWASELNQIWKLLGKKMKADVHTNSHLYSIIPVPNPVIVPGGRFREFYYWDSFWIIKGLLHSEMYHTVKGMLENFLFIVDNYGHIPNGGRVYYLQRSHPPLLTPMIDVYVQVTKDQDFLEEALGTLEAEFSYWMNKHTVPVLKNGVNYTLFRYIDHSQGPRPESYREDVDSARYFRTDSEKQEHYSELKAAAESGWDFSSRWFISNGTNKGNLTNAKTKYIIPVDLNSMMYWNAHLLSKFFRMVGNANKSTYYANKADEINEAVTKILWLDDVGIWLDYDILNDKERDYFYPTNVAPLWTGCFPQENRSYYVGKAMKYIQLKQIMLNLGGIPTTLEHTGEQWDYPNAWPPLQHIMVEGLANSADPWAEELAFEIASRWVRSNFVAYNDTGHMFEKYDSTSVGGHGTGGEYEVQLGFGWTNGVILDLLDRYGDRLRAQPDEFEAMQMIVVGAADDAGLTISKQEQEAVAPAIRTAASGGKSSQPLVALIVVLVLMLGGLATGGAIWYMRKRREQTGFGRTADYRRFYKGNDYQELTSLTTD